MEQTPLQPGSVHLDTLGENEAAFELARRDAAVQKDTVLTRLRLLAADHEMPVLDGDTQIRLREPRDGQCDPVPIRIALLDVERGIAVISGFRGALHELIELLEAQHEGVRPQRAACHIRMPSIERHVSGRARFRRPCYQDMGALGADGKTGASRHLRAPHGLWAACAPGISEGIRQTRKDVTPMDLSLVLTAVAVLPLLCLSGFFSGSETALTAINRATMHQLAGRGSRGAQTALKLTDDNERLIGSILLGNNLVNVLATALATTFFTAVLGDAGVAYATLVMTLLVTIFAEVAPKTYAITNPDQASVRVAPAIAILVRVAAPVVSTISWFVQGAFRLLGVKVDPDAHALAPYDQIRGTIALHHSEGGMARDERDRLLAALDLRERDVDSVMRHRRDIVSISIDEPSEDIVNFCLSSPHTRIPLWRGEPENIVGVLHAKDLLRVIAKEMAEAASPAEALTRVDVMAVAMKPWFVPDTRSLDDQLRAFLKRRSHFALVVDEYGVLQGLLTLEDIIEEIVGEIADEHDIEAEGITRETAGSLIVPGTMSIRSLNRACDWNLPDDEATTVAGLVIHEAQTIPTQGQVFVFHGVRFEVVERERQQITKLRVKQLARPAHETDSTEGAA